MQTDYAKGFEIGFFKRKNGVSEETLLLANKEMEKYFLQEEKNLINHHIVKISENLYADIAFAKTKEDAQKICSKWIENKHALSFLSLIDVVKFDGLEMLSFAEILSSGKFNLHGPENAFEVVSFEFLKNIELSEQKVLMNELNQIVKNFDGFKSRDYYYSSSNGRWIDFIIWNNAHLAEKASEEMMNDPKARLVFSKIEEKSMIFSNYMWVGGAKRD